MSEQTLKEIEKISKALAEVRDGADDVRVLAYILRPNETLRVGVHLSELQCLGLEAHHFAAGLALPLIRETVRQIKTEVIDGIVKDFISKG